MKVSTGRVDKFNPPFLFVFIQYFGLSGISSRCALFVDRSASLGSQNKFFLKWHKIFMPYVGTTLDSG